jgi:SH3-like domain-containing protein
MEGDKILKLKEGQTVEVLELKGNYVRIKYQSIEGWIHKNRVSIK